MAIPNRLLITPKKIRKTEIGKMIDSYPELFLDDPDAEFNVLAVFMMYEKIRGAFIFSSIM